MQGVRARSARRFGNIDLLEALAMFFVIVYHTRSDVQFNVANDSSPFVCVNYCLRSILSTCVPIFFFCNGFLLFNRPFDLQRHIQKTVRLFLLALLWGTLSAVYSGFVIHSVEPVGVKEFLMLLITTKVGWNNHIWYLHTLIILYVFFPFLKTAFDKARPVFLFGLVVAVGVILGCYVLDGVASVGLGKHIEGFNFLGPYNPIRMGHRHALMYFLVGGFVGLHHERILDFVRKNRLKISVSALALVVLSCSLLGFYGIFLSRLDGKLWDNVFQGYGTVFTFANVLLLYLLTICYDRREGVLARTVYLVSVNSLGIYFLQDFVTKTFAVYCLPVLSDAGLADLHVEKLLYCIVITSFCLLLAMGLKRVPYLRKLI